MNRVAVWRCCINTLMLGCETHTATLAGEPLHQRGGSRPPPPVDSAQVVIQAGEANHLCACLNSSFTRQTCASLNALRTLHRRLFVQVQLSSGL